MNGVLIGLVGAGKPGIDEWNNFILLIFLERKFTLNVLEFMILSLFFSHLLSASIYRFIIVGVLSSVLLIMFTSSTFFNAMTHLFLFDWALSRNLILFGANRTGFLSFHLNIDTKSIACNLILIVSWKWHKKYLKRRTAVNRIKWDESSRETKKRENPRWRFVFQTIWMLQILSEFRQRCAVVGELCTRVKENLHQM